jgi:sec-independent protein translocase protein TatC
VLPMAFRWALKYIPPDVELMQHANDYVELLAKMYLAFGLCFELPVLLMFLAKVGIIDAPMMRTYWRQAVMAIMVVAAVVTPSNDPITMLMCAIPMAILYLFSIFLVEKMG